MRKLIFLLPVLLLLFNQREYEVLIDCRNDFIAYTDTLKVLADSTNSGFLYKNDDVLLTARNGTTAGGVTQTSINVATLKATAGQYAVKRGFLCFPGIPNASAVDSVCLFLDGLVNLSIMDTTFQVYGSKYKPTLTTADLDSVDGWQATGAYNGTKLLAAAWNSSAYSANWNVMPFASAGRTAVLAAKGDTLWIAILAERDYNNTWATDDSCEVAFSNRTGATNAWLYVSYTPATASTNTGARGQIYPYSDRRSGRIW
jgi:hypothetical protein